MSKKINISQRKINYLLDYIFSCRCTKDGLILLDDSFFQNCPRMKKDQIIQTINCLDAENLLEVYPPSSAARCPTLRLKSTAFIYRMRNKRENLKFWIPTIISIVALIGGYRQEISWLIQAIKRLLKL